MCAGVVEAVQGAGKGDLLDRLRGMEAHRRADAAAEGHPDRRNAIVVGQPAMLLRRFQP